MKPAPWGYLELYYSEPTKPKAKKKRRKRKKKKDISVTAKA